MALSRESTTYPRWISRASSGSGVRNKRKRTPIQCFCGCAKKKRVCCQLAILRTGVRGGKKVCVSSVIFLCERANTPQTLTIFFFQFLRDIKNADAVSRYVAAASSASSASMTALSPPMSRITCVGCAAPGGAGVPAGFTHTDARSAASTPPCGGGGAKRRKKRRQSRRARRVGSARRRTPNVTNGRANDETRGHAVEKKNREPLLSVTRALPVRPSRASRRRARLRLARTPRRDTP